MIKIKLALKTLFMMSLILACANVSYAQDIQKWTVEKHDSTNFPLIGKHRTVSCRECHLDLVFEGTPSNCEACHWERRQDDRYELRLGLHCGECHTSYTWKNVAPYKWNHVTATGYELRGIHRTLDCVECHGGDGFLTAVSCFDCHQEDYDRSQEPDHAAAGYPIECQICHMNPNTWQGAVFSHDSFVLRGKHQVALCSDCHISGQYAGLPSNCVSCHLTDYENTRDPDHKRVGFPMDCELCHGTGFNTWEEGKYSHTVFVLKGQHRFAACSDCHQSGIYRGLPSLCVDCHISDYTQTTDPDHQKLNFSTDCESCHGTNALTWLNAQFSHTGFILKGAHKEIKCSECHRNDQYTGLPSDCFSCHRKDYNNATSPNHRNLNFSTDCELCHGNNAISWDVTNYVHSSSFPLKGQHKVIPCSACHQKGQYAGTPTECVACHLQDYNNTTDPNHKEYNFSLECELCHGSNAITWGGGQFSHAPYWPLQGAHTNLDCIQCHSSGSNPPQQCYGCHSQDYVEARNPNHTAAGFPTTCELCHIPTHVNWNQAVFDHLFPIKGGKHSGLDCADCHISSNFRDFSCIDCHQHEKSRMDNEHSEVPEYFSYPYQSQSCYACHPQGRA